MEQMMIKAIQYTDADSILAISSEFKLTCEYDSDKPNEIYIHELGLVLSNGHWIVGQGDVLSACEEVSLSGVKGGTLNE